MRPGERCAHRCIHYGSLAPPTIQAGQYTPRCHPLAGRAGAESTRARLKTTAPAAICLPRPRDQLSKEISMNARILMTTLVVLFTGGAFAGEGGGSASGSASTQGEMSSEGASAKSGGSAHGSASGKNGSSTKGKSDGVGDGSLGGAEKYGDEGESKIDQREDETPRK